MSDAKRRAWARRPTPAVYAATVLVWTLASGTLLAGPYAAAPSSGVKGRVAGWEKLVPQVYADAAKGDSHHYTWREPSPTVKQEFRRLSADVARDLCVVAIGGGAGAAAPPHEPLSVKVTGGRASHSTIVLSPGSRLSFKNVDPFSHALYEVGNPQWVPSQIAAGSTREWAASAPGLHQIRDQLFPSFVVYVVVDPAAVELAFPDHEGSFAMALPQGEYAIKAYFDGKPVGKNSVHVGERGLEMKEPLAVGGGEPK